MDRSVVYMREKISFEGLSESDFIVDALYEEGKGTTERA